MGKEGFRGTAFQYEEISEKMEPDSHSGVR